MPSTIYLCILTSRAALWGISLYFFRTPIIPLRQLDFSELTTIEMEKELAPEEKKLQWYRVLV